MLKKDLLEKIKNVNDDDDVNSALVGTDIEEQFKSESATLDVFRSKIQSEKDFKAYIDRLNDTYHAKALKTMKEKGSWETEFNDVLKTKYPNLVTDPKEIEILEMKKKIEDMEKEASRRELLNDAMKYAGEKKIPSAFVERFLGDDLDITKTNLNEFAENWSKAMESEINNKIKSSSYVPGGNHGGEAVSIGASFAHQRNNNKSNGQDPWTKE